MREAISQALWEEMERDERVFILGEEVGLWGGTYAVTKGFYDHFGAERVRDTPISEAAIVGAAIGAALTGLRPVAELMTINFAFSAMDHIVNEAAKLHFYVTHEYDVGRMLELRSQFNNLLLENERISVNDFIVKGVAQTLRQFPNLNASLVDDKIRQHGQVNIGVAVTVEGGLLTVVCREADRKPLRQIAMEIRSMTERARHGKVRPEDVEGSTFTVSNLGMFDVENFAAIINPPETAILAVGTAREVAVVVNGEVKPGLRMNTTISVDHRVSDGAETARFLQALSVYIHEPLRLIL